MLKQLRIQNFKGWKDTGPIRMAPLTLFFGTNSSGKSSLGQFLMMLKQTAELPDRKTVLHPGNRQSIVQLGSWREMVFQRDTRNRIKFEYEWELPQRLTVRDHLSMKSFTGRTMQFAAELELNDAGRDMPEVAYFEYCLPLVARSASSADKDRSILSARMSRKSAASTYEVTTSDNYGLRRHRGRAWAIKNPTHFYGFPDEVFAYYQNADFVRDLNLAQQQMFNSMYYLGPLRTKAERLYTWSGITPESVGFSGENTVTATLAAKNRKISSGPGKRNRLFDETIGRKLKEMGLVEDFKVNLISESRREYEVKVRVRKSSDWVDLPDVGFGISQVLPVLVQCFYAAPGSTILMEQPEIHLHPSAQAALADVLIEVINSREGGRDRNIQLIIETHSEHFLRRLQRRIAEEVISEDCVSAYFADVSSNPAKLKALEVDAFGNIHNWPKNFFGDEMGDVFGQAEAALERRMKMNREAAG